MKRSLISAVLTWVVAGMALAQPTITTDDLWNNDDEFHRLGVFENNITAGPAGANQTWDYSGLQYDSSTDHTIRFTSPGNTPEGSNFPDANVAELQELPDGTINYTFWNKTSTALTFTGVAAGGISVPYQQTYDIMNFPAHYGDTFGGEFISNFTTSGVLVERTGTVITTADAWGTIHLPNGTFENVLRIKTVQEIDQVVQGFTQHITTVSYAWMKPGIRYSVFALTEEVSLTKDGKKRMDFNAHVLDIEGDTHTGGGGDGGGGGGGTATGRWISHLAQFGGNFVSELWVRNGGEATTAGTLTAYDANGNAVGDTNLRIGAGGVQRISHEALGSTASHLSITGCDDCTVTVGYRAASGGGTAHVHQTTPGKEFFMYPGEWDVLFDGVAIVNTGSAAATVTVTQLVDGHEVFNTTLFSDLAPGAKDLAVLSQVSGLSSEGVIRIDSTEDAIVLFLRGSLDGQFLYQNVPFENAGGPGWIAHIAAYGGSFVSELFMRNNGTEEARITLQPYDNNGNALAKNPLFLEAGGQAVLSHEALGTDAGYLSFEGCDTCTVTVGYRAATGGGTAHVHQTQAATEWLIYPGEWNVLFDGLALVNVSNSAAVVTAELLNADGTPDLIATLTASPLEPGNKLLQVFANVFPDPEGRVIRVRSTQEAIAMFLRGNLDGTFLYQNVPLAQ